MDRQMGSFPSTVMIEQIPLSSTFYTNHFSAINIRFSVQYYVCQFSYLLSMSDYYFFGTDPIHSLNNQF